MGPTKLIDQFNQDGYVKLRGFFSEAEMRTLIEDIKEADPKHIDNNLNKGSLTFHSQLFQYSEKIQNFISQPRLVELLAQFIGPNFWVRWDQAVAKGPGAETFPWHQDNGYSKLKDNHYQLWIALTRMTPENGGLWLQPGSHKKRLQHKFEGNYAVYDGTPESPVFIEAQAGDIVLFSSLTLHSTTPNVSQETRWAYVIEYMSLNHVDPGVKPPYFVVARNGKSQPEFVNLHTGFLNPWNHLKYVGYRWHLKQLLPTRLKLLLKRPELVGKK
jgi:ectoine hydroxylase-related dioxygenase (phytanoyl-CoA dioxygenase family)